MPVSLRIGRCSLFLPGVAQRRRAIEDRPVDRGVDAVRDEIADAFELESPQLVEVRLDGLVWAKAGAMVARKYQEVALHAKS